MKRKGGQGTLHDVIRPAEHHQPVLHDVQDKGSRIRRPEEAVGDLQHNSQAHKVAEIVLHEKK